MNSTERSIFYYILIINEYYYVKLSVASQLENSLGVGCGY